jgi:hypothetical protein
MLWSRSRSTFLSNTARSFGSTLAAVSLFVIFTEPPSDPSLAGSGPPDLWCVLSLARLLMPANILVPSMVSDVARPPIMPRVSLTRSLIALRAGTKFRTHSAVARVHGCSVVPLHSAHGRVRTQVIDSHTRVLGLRSERSTRACVKVVAWRPGARVVC